MRGCCMSNICYAKISDLEIDFEKSRITRGSELIDLPQLSFNLFAALFQHHPEIVSYKQLIETVWRDSQISEENVKQRMSMLRRSLSANIKQQYIKNVRGQGYRLSGAVEISYTSDATQEKENNTIFDLLNHRRASSIFSAFAIITCLSIFISSGYAFRFSQTKTIKSQNIQPVKSSLPEQSMLNLREVVSIEPNSAEASFNLNGVDQYLEIKNRKSLDVDEEDFSIETWVKTEAKELRVIVDKRTEKMTGSVQGYALFVYQGYLGFQLANGHGGWSCQSKHASCTNYSSKGYVGDGNLHHVLVSVERDNRKGIKFYVDGVLVNAGNPTGRQGSLSNDSVFRIGSRSSSESGLFRARFSKSTFIATQ